MDSAKFDEYLKDRYEDQITWYEKRSSQNKRRYSVFQWGVIILSASVPVLIATIPKDKQLITILISILLAIGTAALKTFKFQENWINYRTIAETLKKERHYYDAGLDDYSGASDKEALFVERVESLISRHHSLWVTAHTHKEQDQDH